MQHGSILAKVRRAPPPQERSRSTRIRAGRAAANSESRDHRLRLELADEHLGVPTDKGANAGRKIGSLIAGMIAGADSTSDLNRVRHGAMATLFHRPYAPSTLGSFLRQFIFGHVRQLDAVASRFLDALAQRTPKAPARGSRR